LPVRLDKIDVTFDWVQDFVPDKTRLCINEARPVAKTFFKVSFIAFRNKNPIRYDDHTRIAHIAYPWHGLCVCPLVEPWKWDNFSASRSWVFLPLLTTATQGLQERLCLGWIKLEGVLPIPANAFPPRQATQLNERSAVCIRSDNNI
jgi:hypothetical protein